MSSARDAHSSKARANGLWYVRQFGELQFRSGGYVLPEVGRRAVKLLLVRLTAFPGRRHARRELADWLWPDEVQQRHADGGLLRRLRHEIHLVRQLLEPPGVARNSVLAHDRKSVWVESGSVVSDTSEYLRHCLASDHRSAKALVSGEWLPGMRNDWIDAQRQSLTELAKTTPTRKAAATVPRDVREQGDLTFGWPSSPIQFVGRQREVRSVKSALAHHRIVFICGAPGIGKTRLARQAVEDTPTLSRRLWVRLPHGATESDVHDLLRDRLAIARRFDAAPQLPQGADRVFQQVVEKLRMEAAPAVVLDSFDGAAAECVRRATLPLLQALPRLRIVVTARRSVCLAQGASILLAELPIPPQTATLAQVRGNPSVALFETQASMVRKTFKVGPRNVADVIRLCRLLKGHPTALMLAGRLAHQNTVRDLVLRLEREGITMLAYRVPKAKFADSHASLASMYKASWLDLPLSAQETLRAAVVYEGPFGIDDLEPIASLPTLPRDVTALQEHGLVIREPSKTANEQARYYLAPWTREFVFLELPEAQARALRERHRLHMGPLRPDADRLACQASCRPHGAPGAFGPGCGHCGAPY